MTMAEDIKNLASRTKDAGHEYATLVSNTRAQVEDLITQRSQIQDEDEKSQGFSLALGALEDAESTALRHAAATEETLQKLVGLLE